MSGKISRRFLDSELQMFLTGMQSDIVGLTGAVKSLEARMTGAQSDIAGLTGAVASLEVHMTGAQSDIAGLTGRTASLETYMAIAQSDIAGLTGAVSSIETQIAGLTGSVYTLQQNIAGLTGAVVALQEYDLGLTGRTASLETGLELVRVDIAGLTGSVMDLQTYVAGLTGRTASLETGLELVRVDIAGLTGSVMDLQTYVAGLTGRTASLETGLGIVSNDIALLKSYTGAYTVGFTPVLGIGDTNVQGAITTLKAYVDSGLTGIGITGSQGAVGATGVQGYTGVGAQGIQGETGLQGVTGPYLVQGTMHVEQASNVVYYSVTGMVGMSYQPITGLSTQVIITEPSRILSLLSLRYRNLSAGSYDISFLLNSDGYTGPESSEYLGDTRERYKTLYHMTPLLSAGTHDIQAYWKVNDPARQTILMDGTLSSVVLDGALGSTGVKGTTGSQGTTGLVGVTGAFGGPPGVTGARGVDGVTGIQGVTGPGVASFGEFVKILPLENWKTIGVDPDVYGELPVLEFDSVGIEEIDMTIATPLEWDGSADMTLRVGAVIQLPLSTGDQAILRLSYKGFNKTDNVTSLTPFHTHTITKTLVGPSQYDFLEYEFILDKSYLVGKDYIYLLIEKITGTPNVTYIGVCYTQLEHSVSVGAGPTGYQGATGIAGINGATGPVGFTGLQGITGVDGATGPLGVTGLSGVTGIQGITGYQGTTGIVGITGLDGVTGIQGVTGLGVTGPQGSTGLQGSTGIQGVTGLGVTGPVGAGVTGFQGDTGLPGVTGLMGLPGPTGIQGVTGVGGGEMRIITTAGSTVQLMAFGPSADLDNVSLTKTVSPEAISVTITNPSTNVKYISLKAYWSSSDWGSATSCTVTFPETTGQTTLDATQRPLALRYTSSTYADGTINSTIVNSSGSVTVTISGMTASQSNAIQLLW